MPMIPLVVFLLLPQDETVKRLIRAGDEAYAKRDEAAMPAKAVEAYKKALALDDTSTEAYWKIVRVLYWLGSREKEAAKQEPLYREGIEYAKLALAVDPNSVDGHFWLGVMYGLYGQARGILQSLHMVEPMKKELEWVIEKDEKYQQAAAHRVLGRLCFKLPGIAGGDNEKAKKHFRRAIELAPANLLSYYFLAEVLYNENHRDEAKATLKTMLAQPDDPEWLPECKEQRQDAQRLLAELQK